MIAAAIVEPRKPGLALGRAWLESFYQRHPEIKTRYTKPLDYVRACKGDNYLIVKMFFTLYYTIVDEYGVETEHVYNMDEIGFMMGFAASAKVIEIVRNPRKDTGVLYHLQDGNREMVTVIECICADGSSVSPTIIYRSVGDVEKTWFETPQGFPEGALYGRSPNGWTSNLIGLEWLNRNFGPGSATAIMNQQVSAAAGVRVGADRAC